MVAIDDANLPLIFKVSNLNTRKLVIDGDDTGVCVTHEFGDFSDFAGPDEGRGIVSLQNLSDRADDFATGRRREFFKFEEAFFEFGERIGFQTDSDADDSLFGFEKCFARFPALRERLREWRIN